jgi:dCMP deaminase
MCKRLVINAGIERVVVRNTPEAYTVYSVALDWVENDDSLRDEYGY